MLMNSKEAFQLEASFFIQISNKESLDVVEFKDKIVINDHLEN